MLAFAFGVVLLGIIFALKPRTVLPEYTLTFDGETLIARSAEPNRARLQAEAFWVDGTGVHPIRSPVMVDPAGDVAVKGLALPATNEELIVGMIIGHEDSMPSPEAAWDDMASETKLRAGFRVVTLKTRGYDNARSIR
jgi:hypothetical protein